MTQTNTSYFDEAFKLLMLLEGGYSNHPNDRGGETKYGITKRSYPSLDIKDLTDEQAKEIYKRDWWQDEYDLLPKSLAIKVFTMAVNIGPHKAARLLQSAANNCSTSNLEMDGYIGPVTIAVANAIDQQLLLAHLKLLAIDYYTDLCEAQISNRTFLTGWNRRALS